MKSPGIFYQVGAFLGILGGMEKTLQPSTAPKVKATRRYMTPEDLFEDDDVDVTLEKAPRPCIYCSDATINRCKSCGKPVCQDHEVFDSARGTRMCPDCKAKGLVPKSNLKTGNIDMKKLQSFLPFICCLVFMLIIFLFIWFAPEDMFDMFY